LRFNGATLVIVSVSVNGQPYLNQSLPYTVRAFTDVIVAAHRIEARDQLSDTDLRYQRWDMGHLPSGYLTDVKSASGRVSRRSLAAGSIILAKNLAQPIIINRGQDVTVTASTGAITVTARGRALEAGGVGDVIRVQNLNSLKTVRATILNDTSVQVLSL
jgi:flagella basal body P-ring formation protein FlgA